MSDTIQEVLIEKEENEVNEVNEVNQNECNEISQNTYRRIDVSTLDELKIDNFTRVEYAHAIGYLEGKGIYRGAGSEDETWLYEFSKDGLKNGGIAVIRKGKIIGYYNIFTGI
jgi:hypothetical protein